MIKNIEFEAHKKKGWIDVKAWPMHYTKDMILDEIQDNRQLMWFAIEGDGVYFITVGIWQVFLVNLKATRKIPKMTKLSDSSGDDDS